MKKEFIKFCQDIINENREFLKLHPEESSNSVGFVADNIRPEHVEASMWMQEIYKMDISTHNLHDVIVNYKECQIMSKMTLYTNPFLDIKNGLFNPEHLIKFFKQKNLL